MAPGTDNQWASSWKQPLIISSLPAFLIINNYVWILVGGLRMARQFAHFLMLTSHERGSVLTFLPRLAWNSDYHKGQHFSSQTSDFLTPLTSSPCRDHEQNHTQSPQSASHSVCRMNTIFNRLNKTLIQPRCINEKCIFILLLLVFIL